jgi:hypothetical protein
MNETVKKKWATALRSGKYRQTFTRLRNGNKFCCLGVLCDLYRQTHPNASWQGNMFFDDVQTSSIDILTDEVREWAGLGDEEEATLIMHNDPLMEMITGLASTADLSQASLPPHSFNEIAELIENYF